MSRLEFTRDVYAQIVRRAMLPSGEIACEGCGLVLGKKPYNVDHTIPDALQIDKSRKLTAEDGKLLGIDCCHAPKTKVDVRNIAEAKRREAKYLGMKIKVKVKVAQRPKAPKLVRDRLPMPSARPIYEASHEFE